MPVKFLSREQTSNINYKGIQINFIAPFVMQDKYHYKVYLNFIGQVFEVH